MEVSQAAGKRRMYRFLVAACFGNHFHLALNISHCKNVPVVHQLGQALKSLESVLKLHFNTTGWSNLSSSSHLLIQTCDKQEKAAASTLAPLAVRVANNTTLPCITYNYSCFNLFNFDVS
jgi:hypothetical protein